MAAVLAYENRVPIGSDFKEAIIATRPTPDNSVPPTPNVTLAPPPPPCPPPPPPPPNLEGSIIVQFLNFRNGSLIDGDTSTAAATTISVGDNNNNNALDPSEEFWSCGHCQFSTTRSSKFCYLCGVSKGDKQVENGVKNHSKKDILVVKKKKLVTSVDCCEAILLTLSSLAQIYFKLGNRNESPENLDSPFLLQPSNTTFESLHLLLLHYLSLETVPWTSVGCLLAVLRANLQHLQTIKKSYGGE